MLKPQNLYMHNVIEWYRNAIQRMDAYQCPQQHVRVDRGVERRGVEQRGGGTAGGGTAGGGTAGGGTAGGGTAGGPSGGPSGTELPRGAGPVAEKMKRYSQMLVTGV